MFRKTSTISAQNNSFHSQVTAIFQDAFCETFAKTAWMLEQKCAAQFTLFGGIE